jgi:cytochrome c oxidase assembly protein subunit 15
VAAGRQRRSDSDRIGRKGGPVTYRRGLHRFSLFTAISTFFLVIAGGLVTSTQSGLSVPDWPNTYGHFMFAYPFDEMVGGILYEHSHRMIASVVGFLTVILTVWVWRREERRWVRNLSAAALTAVIVQGVLGGITVLFLLPTPVSVAHATLAQTFFAAVAALALVTSRWWIDQPQTPLQPHGASGGSLTTMTVVVSAMVWVQLILGAVMRHTDAGLAVPDFPLAYGHLVPSLSPGDLDAYTRVLNDADIRLAADGPITASQVAIHLIHRYWGIITGLVLLWTAHRLYRLSPAGSRHRKLGVILAGLTLSQIALGAFTVLSRKAVEITTAHVALGALLLVFSVISALHCYRSWGFGHIPAHGRVGEAAA